MNTPINNSFIKLTNAGLLLSKEVNIDYLINIMVEEAIDLSCSDLSCLYLCKEPDKDNCNLSLVFKKGKFDVPREFKYDNILINFIKDSKESIVLLERKNNIFIDLLLNHKMQSGIALPLINKDLFLGVLFSNSVLPYHFNREKIDILESFIKLAGEIFNYYNRKDDLKAYFKRIKSY